MTAVSTRSFDCKISNRSHYKFKTIHGRTYNNVSEVYMLPADDDEHSRLDVQHHIMKILLNGMLYPAADKVRAALAPNPHQRPAILDLGTGSGRWALEMALEFPHAEVVGMDLAPPTLSSVKSIPDNCRFEVDDANYPMDHYTNAFDVVHCRAVDVGIKDMDLTLYHIARMLRPGGILLLSTVPPQFLDPEGNRHPVTDEGEPGYTALQRFFGMVYMAYKSRGSSDAAAYWDGYLQNNPNYGDIVSDEFMIPIGAWEQGITPQRARAAEMMRHDTDIILHAFKPLLLTEGFPEDYLDKLIRDASSEMRDYRIKAYAPWKYTVAVRNNTQYQPRTGPKPPLDPNYFLIGPLISKHGRFIQQEPLARSNPYRGASLDTESTISVSSSLAVEGSSSVVNAAVRKRAANDSLISAGDSAVSEALSYSSISGNNPEVSRLLSY